MNNNLKYPLGFLLTKYDFENKYNWKEYCLNAEWILYYDTSSEFSHYESGNTQITILGYFLDIRDGLLEREEIINTLIVARKVSYHKFLDELSFLNGRFVLILTHENETLLFHDVGALRSVFYHIQEPIIASHDTLINEVMENKLKILYKNPKNISISSQTRFENVYALLTNMTFNINKKRIERYYPLSNYEVKSKSEIKNELIYYFKETIKWLKNTDYNLLLSVTGGGDSKLSLAVLKPIVNNIETFTYLRDTSNSNGFVKRTYKNDEKIVSSIVNNLNFNHKFFNISTDKEVDKDIIQTIKHNVFSAHSLNLANDYYKLYGSGNYLHIRSTGFFNIGKYIFPKESLREDEWNIDNITKYIDKWMVTVEDKKEHLINELNHAQLNNFYNYNPLELLFITYRMIQRHSGLVGESDIAFNTMLLLNSRKIVDLLLSYPVEERAENNLYIDLIDELWPILNYWSINSVNTMADKYKLAEKEIQQQKEVNKSLFPTLIETRTTQSAEIDCTPYKYGHYYKFRKEVSKNDYYLIRINLSKLSTNMSLKFKIKFFNHNEERGRIKISSNLLDEEKDIIDLYNEKKFVISRYDINRDIYFKVQHLSPKGSPINAIQETKVWVGDFELFI